MRSQITRKTRLCIPRYLKIESGRIFCIYTLPLGATLRHHNLNYHICADDTQVYCASDLENQQNDLDHNKFLHK